MYRCADPLKEHHEKSTILTRGTPSFPLEPVEDSRHFKEWNDEGRSGPVVSSLDTYSSLILSYNSIEVDISNFGSDNNNNRCFIHYGKRGIIYILSIRVIS
jgi:hypothetical protein